MDAENVKEDQTAFNTRLQSQVDKMDVKMTDMDVKRELLCKAVADLTQVVKGQAPVMASTSTEPLHPTIDPTVENREQMLHM